MAGGRPTILTQELLASARDYLASCVDVVDNHYLKNDYKDRLIEVKLPSIEGLAIHLNIHRSAMYIWEATADYEKDPNSLFCQFFDILEKLRAMQANRLINNGLMGSYSPVIAKLLLSSKHGYIEKSDITSGGNAIGPTPEATALANVALAKFLGKDEDVAEVKAPDPVPAKPVNAPKITTSDPAGGK